jgi:hypothetical protein
MPTHEFIAKTLEVDWLAPMFTGVRLTGDFFINGSIRVPGEALFSTKGNLSPDPERTTATFRGGTPPRLHVDFHNTTGENMSLFRDIVYAPWAGITVFFDDDELDVQSAQERVVTYKSVRFRRLLT